MMQSNIQKFTSEVFGEIRTCQVNNQIMFVGKDVAMALGYAKPENAISTHVDIEDKTTTLIQGTGSNYKSKVVIINESGLYSLILSSKLSQAKAFKRWVTSEVLPQIRQTGG
jgi:prophage antirepressor-like protein